MVGEWAAAARALRGMGGRVEGALGRAVRQEALGLQREIVRGLTEQNPGGSPIRPLAPTTLAKRQLEGFRGSKALIERSDLRNSIATFIEGDVAFVGVSRSAKTKDGRALTDIAKMNEFGFGPIVIPVTPRMRRFLAVLMARAGAPRSEGRGTGRAVVRIPPRPFLRPAFEAFRKGAAQRFLGRVGAELLRRT
jgi:hypothetical protein